MKLLLGSILTFFKGGGSFCMAEFLFWQNSYAIFFYLSYFLFVVLILHVKMLEFFGGNLQRGWNCLEDFFVGGGFSTAQILHGEFSAGAISFWQPGKFFYGRDLRHDLKKIRN
jgi:hypothetical protein